MTNQLIFLLAAFNTQTTEEPTWNQGSLWLYQNVFQAEALDNLQTLLGPLGINTKSRDLSLFKFNVMQNLGLHSQGIKEINIHIKNNPLDLELVLLRAKAYFSCGENDLAYEDFHFAIVKGTKDPTAYTGKALSLVWGERKNRYNEALRDCEKAIELDPKLEECYTIYANVLEFAGDSKKSYLVIQEGIERCGKTPDLLIARGNKRSHHGDWKKAMEDYNLAIKLRPDATGYFNRASLNLAMNQTKEAIADFSLVIKERPRDFNTYSSRGRAYEQDGQDAAAIADYTKFINDYIKSKNGEELKNAMEDFVFRDSLFRRSELYKKMAQKDLELLNKIQSELKVFPRLPQVTQFGLRNPGFSREIFKTACKSRDYKSLLLASGQPLIF